MVDFPTTVRLVHASYEELGGEYGSEDVAQDLMGIAGELWQENKEQLREMAEEAAKEAIKEALRSYLS